MILTRIDPVQAGIERFTTRRMTAERLTSAHYPEIRRLHLHPQVMKTLSPENIRMLGDFGQARGFREAQETRLRQDALALRERVEAGLVRQRLEARSGRGALGAL